ncbi:ABC transporter ATP-binding protein [Azovibrio restrictus]|uniref:ABC transporter ATP-binding protein n=1 Tax=Azovibrio restrictus TaxID=146938 RepID=UPI00042751A4|nr:ABC transporter ATP-binding protein [Azovibrio restrictus]MCE1172824.1 ABC transporter ATP-binding protein [Azovibrio sp.]
MRDLPGPAILLEQLRFRWQRQAPLCLDIPALDIQAGERVFLYGPSGSGKSTLLGLLGAVHQPESGRIEVLGQDLARLSGSGRDRFRVDHIGFIFQQFNLIPYLPVLDNVLLPCRFSARRRARAGQDHGRQEARRLLEALGLEGEQLGRQASQLSVGQQQRVAAARALIGSPELIIADEPTSALDADRQDDFLELLLQECAAQGTTLLFVSHDHRLAPHFTRELSLVQLNGARP